MNPKKEEQKFIGYYNSHEYPVAFSRRNDGSAIMLEPGAPVCTDGYLVTFPNQELEEQVSRGSIMRIRKDHPNFIDWDKKADQRKSATLVPLNREGKPQNEGEDNKMRKITTKVPEEARAVISSKSGLQLNNEAAQERLAERVHKSPKKQIKSIDLPDGVEDAGNGTYRYNNETFESVSALMLFLDMSKAAPVIR
jgi:hypothetical protein